MATKKPANFNPAPVDADGDGIVQEGTEFERPIEPAFETEEEFKASKPVAPSTYTAKDGDSYAAIAEKFPKDGMSKHERSLEIWRNNGGKFLHEGTEVKL